MLAVSGTEGVHHIAVCVGSKDFGEIFLACLHLFLGCLVSGVFFLDAYRFALLFRIEAKVLQHQYLARFERSGFVLSLCAILCKLNRTAERSADSVYNLAEAELSLHFAFRLAHVAHDDERTAIVQNVLERRKRTADTGVISNLTVFIEWHIEIHTNNRLLAGEFVIFNRHNIKYLVVNVFTSQ